MRICVFIRMSIISFSIVSCVSLHIYMLEDTWENSQYCPVRGVLLRSEGTSHRERESEGGIHIWKVVSVFQGVAKGNWN